MAFRIILILLFLCSPVYAGHRYNSNTGTRDYCLSIADVSKDVESKRCVDIRVSDGFLSDEGGYYLIRTGFVGTSGTSMTTSDTAVPLSYVFVKKAIASSSNPGFDTGTLADGEMGQMITIFTTEGDGTSTYTLTPTTKTGFNSLVFYGPDDFATLIYIGDVAGWIIIAESGTTINF